MKGGKSEEMECDVLLVCVGRRPYTENLGLEVGKPAGGDCVSFWYIPRYDRMWVSVWTRAAGYQ